MGKRAPLAGGLDHYLPNHNTTLGRRLRTDFDLLIADLGVNGDRLLQKEVSRVAWLRLKAHVSATAWAEVRDQRERGRGRRPSVKQLERAARRAALDDATATAALDRLRALAAQQRRTPSPGHNALADALLTAPELTADGESPA